MKVREAGEIWTWYLSASTPYRFKLLNNSAYPNIVEDYAYTFALLKR